MLIGKWHGRTGLFPCECDLDLRKGGVGTINLHREDKDLTAEGVWHIQPMPDPKEKERLIFWVNPGSSPEFGKGLTWGIVRIEENEVELGDGSDTEVFKRVTR